MAKRYKQFCGLARALDVVGERWTLLVVRSLLLGPKRYGDLQAQLPGITTNLLAKRLHEMQAAGLVAHKKLAAPANVAVYALTDAGLALEPAIMELARWGGRFMDGPHPGDTLDIGWGLLSLKRRYRGGANGSAELRIGERTFALEFEPAYLRVEERETPRPDLRLVGPVEAFRALFFAGPPTPERLAALRIRVERGSAEEAAAFLSRFEPPPERPRPRGSVRREDRESSP